MNIYDEEAAKLKDELTKHYVLKKTDDKDEELYATRPLDGIEVVWRFDLQLEYVTCTVQSV